MIAYVLSTGDEVLLGDIVDTNSAFLCNASKQLGIDVKKIIAVGDNTEEITSSIEQISSAADICFVTGGLGPTQDDVTALACSRAAGDKYEISVPALKSMEIFFAKKGFDFTKENEKQALMPSSAGVLENHAGTAPGFYIKINTCWFFFMPGVPSEMKIMFENQVQPYLISWFNLNRDIFLERLTVFGLPESTIGYKLRDFTDHFPHMRLGFKADFPTIEVKIILSDDTTGDNRMDDDQSRLEIKKAKQWVMNRLEYKVVSEQGRSIAQEVGHLLMTQKKTLAIAESCTGGLISNMITDVAGSSDYFLFSGVTYSNEAKMNILNVKEQTLLDHGAVHEQTAVEMATGARACAGADYAISTTGIAGPGGGTNEKPVGRVCIGVAGPDKALGHTYTLNYGERKRNKRMFATMALELLRRSLVESGKTV